MVRFKVHIARLERGQSVYVAGNRQELGGWDNTRAVPLAQTGGSTWEVDVPLSRSLFPIQYKYLLKDNKGGVVPEEGADIELALDTTARKPSTMIVVNDGHFRVSFSPSKQTAGLCGVDFYFFPDLAWCYHISCVKP